MHTTAIIFYLLNILKTKLPSFVLTYHINPPDYMEVSSFKVIKYEKAPGLWILLGSIVLWYSGSVEFVFLSTFCFTACWFMCWDQEGERGFCCLFLAFLHACFRVFTVKRLIISKAASTVNVYRHPVEISVSSWDLNKKKDDEEGWHSLLSGRWAHQTDSSHHREPW